MVYIVLFEPEKPANVGNIIRTCRGFDARLIIIGHLNFDLSDHALKRAGMDYLIGSKIERLASFEEFYQKHPSKNIYYITRYSNKVYSKVDFSDVLEDVYLVFGRESSGIPHDILRKNFFNCLRIPMVSDARSFNLSNSVAIVLSEVERQRNFYNLATSETIKGEDFLFQEDKND